MTYAPPRPAAFPDPVVIHIQSETALGTGWAHATANPADFVYAAANRAYYVPFRVIEPYVVAQAFFHTGTVVSGNFDIGLYSNAGTRLTSLGSTAMSGALAIQSAALAYTLPRGEYYMAFALDNTTARVIHNNMPVAVLRVLSYLEESSAFPLPATATMVRPTDAMLPFFGITKRSVI